MANFTLEALGTILSKYASIALLISLLIWFFVFMEEEQKEAKSSVYMSLPSIMVSAVQTATHD